MKGGFFRSLLELCTAIVSNDGSYAQNRMRSSIGVCLRQN